MRYAGITYGSASDEQPLTMSWIKDSVCVCTFPARAIEVPCGMGPEVLPRAMASPKRAPIIEHSRISCGLGSAR